MYLEETILTWASKEVIALKTKYTIVVREWKGRCDIMEDHQASSADHNEVVPFSRTVAPFSYGQHMSINATRLNNYPYHDALEHPMRLTHLHRTSL